MLLGKAEGVITLDISDLTNKVGMANSQLGMLDSAAGRFDSLDAQLRSVGTSTDRLGTGFLALGGAILAPMAIGVKGAIDLEQSMKNVEVALGDVSEHDFSALSDQIIEIGASGEFSATEIAVVSEELAKAGFAIDDIMSGDPAAGFGNMAQAVSDLAAATGDGLGPAVEGIVVAMSTWKPEIVGVENAVTDATRAADIFTIAANESTAGVSDIISGMRNFGPTAALMGVGFDEAAASIAVFTNYGLRAREAGTSLTRALTVLADPTSEAAELMNELGIAAFDAEENFVGLPSLMSQLQDKMGGMSQEAKLAALNTIFGAEAMDVMGLAVLGAGDDVEALIDIMAGGDGFVSASDQARERTNTLAGSLERLGEVSATALAVLARGLIGPIRLVSESLDSLISAFVALPKPVTTAIGLVITSIGLLFTATGSFLLMGPRVVAFMNTARAMSALPGILGAGATAFLRLGNAIRFMLIAGSGIGLIVAAIAGLVKLDLFGFGDAWDRAADAFRQARDAGSTVVGVLNGIAAALKSFDIGPLNAVADVLTGAATGWMAFWDAFNVGATQGEKNVASAIDTTNTLIDRIEDASGADGYRYLLMETNVDTGELEQVGEILESHDDPDDPTRWWARVEIDGEEHEVWIDKNTNEITPIPVEVQVENEEAVPSMLDRIHAGFDRIRGAGETMRMPWLEDFGQLGMNAVQNIMDLQGAFDYFRLNGSDPVHASLAALSKVFPGMNGLLVPMANGWMAIKDATAGARDTIVDLVDDGFDRLQSVASTVWDTVSSGGRKAWRRFTNGVEGAIDTVSLATDVFTHLLGYGMNPVEAGLRTLGIVFPSLGPAMNTAVLGMNKVIDTFQGFRARGLSPLRAGIETAKSLFRTIDWSGIGADIMSGLRSAFSGIGSVIGDLASSVLEGLTGISDSIGNWIADLFDTDEGTVGGGAGQGKLGHALTDEMRDKLETAAKGAWERAWDNFRDWVSLRTEALGDWVLDTGIPTLTGWLVTAAGAVWDALKSLAGWAWDGLQRLGAWTLEVPVPELDSAITDVWDWVKAKIMPGDAEGREISVGMITVTIAGLVKGWSIDLWTWIKQQIVGTKSVEHVDGQAIGGPGAGSITIDEVGITITDWALDVITDLHDKVDEDIENALGGGFVYVVNISLDYAFKLVEDPFSTIRTTLLVMAVAALGVLAVTAGISAVATLLGIAGLGLLAYYVVNQIMDYFDRNPAEIERLKVRVGELWTDLKESDFGWFFTGIEGLYKIISDVVGDLIQFYTWLDNLPGPLGKATDAVEKLVIALTALSAIAFIGGMGGKTRGGRNIGFIGGLLRGLWEIARFPFNLIFKPVQTIKRLLDIGGKGSRGGRGTLGFFETLRGVIRLPFRTAKLGIQSFANSFKILGNTWKGLKGTWDTFFRGFNRNMAQLRKDRIIQSLGQALDSKNFKGWTKFIDPKTFRIKDATGFLKQFGVAIDDTVTRAGKLESIRRGIRGVFEEFASGKGPVRAFTRAMLAIGNVMDRPVAAISRGIGNYLKEVGRLYLQIPSIRRVVGTMELFVKEGFQRVLDVFRSARVTASRNLKFLGDDLMRIVRSIGARFGLNMRVVALSLATAIDNVFARLPLIGNALRVLFSPKNFRFLGQNMRALATNIFGEFASSLVRGTGNFLRVVTLPFRLLSVTLDNLLIPLGDRVRSTISRIFGPKSMGIIANPKAFAAFNVLGDMFDNIASRAGALKKVGGFFDDIGRVISSMVKRIGGVSGAFNGILRVATRLNPALRAIATAFAFFGIESLIGKLGGLSGIFDHLKNAWSALSDAFAEGGMRGVISKIVSTLWDGLKSLPGIVMDAISGLREMGLSGIWDWIKESASNIDWKLVGTIIIVGLSLLIAGIPGLLVGIVGPFLWEWLYDTLSDFGWDRLGNMLESGFRNALEILRNVGSWIMDILQSALSFGWDFLREHGTTIMQALLDGLIAGGLTVWNWLSSLAAWLATAVSGAWDWLKENGTELLDTLLQAMITAGLTVYNWLSTLGDWLKSAASGVWDWLSDKAGPLFDALLQAMITAGMTVWTWLSNLGDWLKGATAIAWDWLSDKAGQLFDGLLQAMITAGLSVWNWLSSLGAWLATAVTGVWDWLTAKGSEIMAWLVTGMEDGFWAAWDWLSGLASRLGGAISGVWDWLKGKGTEVLAWLVTGLEDGFWAAWDWLAGLVDRLMAAVGLEDTWDWLKENGADLLQSLADGFVIGWEAASAWLGDLTDKVLDAAGEAWDIFIDGGRQIMEGLLDGIEQGWSTVSNWVSTIPSKIKGILLAIDPLGLLKDIGTELWDGLKGGFETAFNGAQSFFEGIGKTIKGWIGSVASWFGLGGDDDSVTADQLIDIDLNELATQIDAALAAAFRARGTGSDLAVALSEYLQENVRAAFMDIQITEGVNLGQQIAENLDAEVTKGIGVLSGDSLSSALQQWFNRGTALLKGLLPTTFQNFRETINTAVTTDIGAMDGGSLSTALHLWFIRATALLAPLMTSTFTGIREMINTAVTTDIGAMDGSSLSNALATWFMKAKGLLGPLITTGFTGIRDTVNDAVVADIGLMDGTSLGGAISDWFDRGIGVAIPLIETALTSITTAFTKMVDTTMAAMSTWSAEIGSLVETTAGEMAGDIATANASSTTSFESFVSTTITRMGEWFISITTIVDNAMTSVREDITSGSAQSLSAVTRNFNAMEDAISTAMRNASSSVSSEAGRWPGIIDGFYYSMYAAGQRVGHAAGDGVADGIRNKIGEVRSAANEIIGEVMRAMDAAAALGSPSKITTYFGEMIGMGPAVGIRSMIPVAIHASTDYMERTLGVFDRYGRGYEWSMARQNVANRQNYGSSRTTIITMNNDYTITQQPGENGADLARTVVQTIEKSFDDVIGEG